MSMRRVLFEDVHEDFRASFRTFLDRHVTGQEGRYGEWERDGLIPREVYALAGQAGFLGISMPETHGGSGMQDFRFNLVVGEEAQRAGVGGFGLSVSVHSDMCMPYLQKYCNEEQRDRWFPEIISGESILAIAMTEPGVGSDLAALSTTARREGDHFVLDGAKTFITNGINSDLVIVAAKTDPSAGAEGISLIVVERGMPGFERGHKLQKIGQHAIDTAEMSFDGTPVPVENLLGHEGEGLNYLMMNLAQERVSIAASAVAAAEAALGWTLDYARSRRVFGQRLGSLQSVRFTLAELGGEIAIARTFVDRCVEALNARQLTIQDAATAKWWCTELQGRVMDRCLQLHGGYGYMLEYPIARAYVDARTTRIYGGANEVMKEIIGRSLGL
jgi:alkylation response protein AidB-like acyl-CoA dehydrogenase